MTPKTVPARSLARRLSQRRRSTVIHLSGSGPTGMRAGFARSVDMLKEMLEKSRSTAKLMDLRNAEFREGILEALPVDNDWAHVVLSNGVINLCADKKLAFSEIWRILRSAIHSTPSGMLAGRRTRDDLKSTDMRLSRISLVSLAS